MASEEAVRLQADWMGMPAEFFETLTFGELEVGQRFIALPSPGDNSGHGGFKGVHCIYMKTRQRVVEAAPGLPYGVPTGRAEEGDLGIWIEFPDSMPVIIVV